MQGIKKKKNLVRIMEGGNTVSSQGSDKDRWPQETMEEWASQMTDQEKNMDGELIPKQIKAMVNPCTVYFPILNWMKWR